MTADQNPRSPGSKRQLRETDEHAGSVPVAAKAVPVVVPEAIVPVRVPHNAIGVGRVGEDEDSVTVLGRHLVAVLPEVLEGRLVHAGLGGLPAQEYIVNQTFFLLLELEQFACLAPERELLTNDGAGGGDGRSKNGITGLVVVFHSFFLQTGCTKLVYL